MRRFIGPALGAAALLAACSPPGDGEQARGPGLDVADLPPAQQASVYGAATRAAFNVGPSLTLLLAPTLLPRTSGYEGGAPVPDALRRAILDAGVAQGVCTPVVRQGRTPTCHAEAPGYVVRVSEPFRLRGDSLQVYLMAERYDTPASGVHQPFRFEGAYQLVRRGGGWTVVRQARVKAR